MRCVAGSLQRNGDHRAVDGTVIACPKSARNDGAARSIQAHPKEPPCSRNRAIYRQPARTEPKATRAAQLIDDAMEKVIDEAKHLTGDLGGKASTTQMGDAVAAAV